MKLKLKEFFKISQSIATLISSPLSQHIGLRLKKFARAYQQIIEDYKEANTNLIKGLGQEDGQGFTIPDDDKEAGKKYRIEQEKLLEEEVELPELKIKASDIIPKFNSRGDHVLGATLSPIDFSNLDFLFEQKQPEPSEDVKDN